MNFTLFISLNVNELYYIIYADKAENIIYKISLAHIIQQLDSFISITFIYSNITDYSASSYSATDFPECLRVSFLPSGLTK